MTAKNSVKFDGDTSHKIIRIEPLLIMEVSPSYWVLELFSLIGWLSQVASWPVNYKFHCSKLTKTSRVVVKLVYNLI